MKPKDHTEEIDVQKYWRALQRRCSVIAAIFCTATGLATLAALRQKPSYDVVAKLLVKSEDNPSLTGLNLKIGKLEALGTSHQKDPMLTQAETVKSIPIFRKALQSVPRPASQKPMTPEALMERFKIKAIPGADVLQISYQSNNPEYAVALVNAVVNEYMASNIIANREEATTARRFITSQLPTTEAAVQKAEMALRKFKERDRVIALTQETTQAVTNIGNLDTQIDQAKAAFADANARAAAFRRQLGMDSQTATTVGTLRKAPGVQEALSKLQAVQSQLAIEQTRLSDNHPKVVNLQQQVSALSRVLSGRVAEVGTGNQAVSIGQLQPDDLKQTIIASYLQSEVELNGLSQRIAQLTALQNSHKNRSTVLPRLEANQRELERELEAAQVTYKALLAKLQEVQVAENQKSGNVRVVQAASAPRKPSYMRRMLMIAGGSLGGLILGVGVALLLDMLDQSVSTLKAVKEELDYMLLGVIPAYNGATGGRKAANAMPVRTVPKIMNRDRPMTMEREAYRLLQSHIAFLTGDRGVKSMIITSALDGEGKSEVAANLAVEMAQQGKRVLLVDTNMNHPSLSAIWDIDNAVGLSRILVGERRVEEGIHEVMPNLFVIPTGGMAPDPMALLNSQRMLSLMTELSSRYDRIIFDTPAVSAWGDAAVMDRLADGIILVARPGVLKNTAAQLLKEKLGEANQKVLGMIVNGVNLQKEPDSYVRGDHYKMVHDRKQADLAEVPSRRRNFRV
jgi:polysaccharide biosynthesis transport protein